MAVGFQGKVGGGGSGCGVGVGGGEEVTVLNRRYVARVTTADFCQVERLSMTNRCVSFQNSTTREYQGVKYPDLSMSARSHVVIASDSTTEIRINNYDLVFQLLQGAS